MLAALGKLRNRFDEIAATDYFDSPAGTQVGARLDRIKELLAPKEETRHAFEPAAEEYRGKRWVTRPRPDADRLACIWLIRRLIDPDAVIRYATEQSEGEIGFDMNDAQFGHQGELCSFEVMLKAFKLDDDPALKGMGEIVHEIDLRDGKYARAEAAGVDRVIDGWMRAGLADRELEGNGVALFEGLYQALGTTDEHR